MRKASPIIIAALALTVPSSLPSQATSSFVIDNVNVVDVAAGTVIAGQRVAIVGSRITEIGPATTASVPTNAIVVDGRGKYLIPGLWDMHVHVTGLQSPGHMFGLLLANGITGVRDMGTGVEGLVRWRGEVAQGRILGPRVIGSACWWTARRSSIRASPWR
jgi:imidazolonepropionase-like amidohydrolase